MNEIIIALDRSEGADQFADLCPESFAGAGGGPALAAVIALRERAV